MKHIKKIIEELDNFFNQHKDEAKKSEVYGLDLSRILHSLADELEGVELESINDTCSKLENLCYETKELRKELRSSPTQQRRDQLRTNGETIINNINSFRHGGILKKYKAIYSESESKPHYKISDREAKATANIEEPSSPVKEEETGVEAIRLAREIDPDAPQKKILAMAKAFIREAKPRKASLKVDTVRAN